MNAIGNSIRDIQAQRDRLQGEIYAIAAAHIPDFHWMDYHVSTFWDCEGSPIGVCVFKRNWDYHNGHYGEPTECRYCGGPVERK